MPLTSKSLAQASILLVHLQDLLALLTQSPCLEGDLPTLFRPPLNPNRSPLRLRLPSRLLVLA